MIKVGNKTLKADVFSPGASQEFMKKYGRIEVLDYTGGPEDDETQYYIDWDIERDPDEITPLEWEQRALKRRIDAFKRMERPAFEVDALLYQFDRLKRMEFANRIVNESVVKAGQLTLGDGSKVNVDSEKAAMIVKFLKKVGNDAEKFEREMLSSKKQFDAVVEFMKQKGE